MLKKIIIIVVIVLSLLSIYLGSYLPWGKARAYITALKNVRNVRSVEDFKENFNKTLNFYSPIGQEEIVKFLSTDLGSQFMKPGQPEEILRALVNYIEPYMFQNNVRHMIAMAKMYEAFWQHYKHEEDFKKAEAYYRKAYAIGPKLPPVLFGMINLYKNKGDDAKVREIAMIILNYWPDTFPVVNISGEQKNE